MLLHYIVDSLPLVVRSGLDISSVYSEHSHLRHRQDTNPGKVRQRQTAGTSVGEDSDVNVAALSAAHLQ